MRILLQRAKQASVQIEGADKRTIGQGLVVLLGIEHADNEEDLSWLVNKLLGLRIFGDQEGKMNLALDEVQGELLIVSQFTLHASTKKGNRPSYIKAAPPELAEPLYQMFVKHCREQLGEARVKTGEFGAMMDVELINQGPVTIFIDSKNRE